MKTYSQRLVLLLSLLLALSAPAWAEVTLHASHSNVNSSASATSTAIGSFAVSNGDTIVIIVAFGGGGSTVSGISDGQNTYAQCTACTATNIVRAEVWTAKVGNVIGFSVNLNPTVTYTAGSKASFSETSWAGVDSINTSINGTTSSSANPTASLTTSDPYNNACITGFAESGTTTGSAGANGTLDTSAATTTVASAYLAVMHNNVANTGTCTTDLTDSSAIWAIVQIELRSSQWAAGTGGALNSAENAACAIGTSCVITLSKALGAGHLLIVTTGSGASGNAAEAISTITDNGSSANTYTIDSGAACFDSTGGESGNMAYVLSTNSGAATTITITLGASSSVAWQASAIEVPYDSSISPITFDTSSQQPQALSTSHTVPSISLAHTNEFVYQAIKMVSGNASAISSPFILGSSSSGTNVARVTANSYDATTAWTTTNFRACLGVEAFAPAQTGKVVRHRSSTY